MSSKRIIVFLVAFVLCFSGSLILLTSNQSNIQTALAEDVQGADSGQLNYSDGTQYNGDILFGRIRNGTGSYTWSTGESYEGTWENDAPSGTGKMVWPGLGVYEGEFAAGKRHGHGVFTWTYETDPVSGQPLSFDGDWANDKIGSSGTMTFANLGVYEGEFANGIRSGIGVFTWDNGDQYYGAWANDQIEGEGILTLADGTVLEGTFSKSILTKGTATYAVDGGKATRDILKGKTQATVQIAYDNGTVVSGKLNGEEFTGNVTITYASGDKYFGTLVSGFKSGKGTYTWSSGAHYVGEWSNDKMNGTGKYYYTSDETILYLTGSFVNGSPDGSLIYVSDNKLKYQTVWKNGDCTKITYKGK